MATPIKPLSTTNHDRGSVGLRYVYPVVSRRAGGVSIGINLNPNNACNWACIYCQVPDLTRGGPPPIDLSRLAFELNTMLDDIQHGEFMQLHVPADVRTLVDIAFSGNGEPTSAAEFADAVDIVIDIMRSRDLADLPLRLITNGSLVHQATVKRGLLALSKVRGEVWFKLDAASPERGLLINGVNQQVSLAITRLRDCAAIVPTWVQTCMFEVDGQLPPATEVDAYVSLLESVSDEIRGVLLYGLARQSMQQGASRIGRVPEQWLEQLGQRISVLALDVKVSH